MSDAAMMHYRVEITGVEPSGDPATTPGGAWMANKIRRPKRMLPTSVRVFDRTGAEVLMLSFPTTEAGNQAHDRIVDDLIALDVDAFRAKHGIVTSLPGPEAIAASRQPVQAVATPLPSANIAGAQYRVERVGAGNIQVDINPIAKHLLEFIAPGQLDEQIQEAVSHTTIPEASLPEGWAPAKEPLHATTGHSLRIIARDGRVVFTREEQDPAPIETLQSDLARDLAALEPAAFEAKYGITH
jgi:hypothetical protein